MLVRPLLSVFGALLSFTLKFNSGTCLVTQAGQAPAVQNAPSGKVV